MNPMPAAPRYDIDTAAFWENPYPDYARLRNEAPVAFVPQLGAVLLTRRDDVFHWEKEIDVFSSDQPGGLMTRLMGQNMMRKDGPEHMAERKVYIADGHHRYETMLAFRDELRAHANSPRSSVEYGVMFFCNMDDPGLVVFPTHRILHGLASFDRAELLERARAFFSVEEAPLGTAAGIREELTRRSQIGVTFAMATPRTDRIAYLRLRDDLDDAAAPALPSSPALRSLDVTVLHALVFETLLGITREAQASQTNLRYVKSWDGAVAEVQTPGVQAVFFMNPTKVSQVKAVSDVGEVMPQKSTFFYPKIASGLVMNPVDPAEEVDAV